MNNTVVVKNENIVASNVVSLEKGVGEGVLDLLPIAVFVCDQTGAITSYNKKALELWGTAPVISPASRFIGPGVLFDANGKQLDPDNSPIRQTLRDGKERKNLELILERTDSSRIPIKADIAPLFDERGETAGAITSFSLSLHAVNLEAKVAERTAELWHSNEQLRKSEERYHRMVEEIEDYAIILLDSDGIIQNWNRGAEKIKGYREDEIVGKSFRVFYLKEDRDRNLPEQLIERARTEGKAVHEGWRVRKDGTRFWGSIVITALHDEGNNITGFTKITRDLTERKNADDILREYSARLEFQNKELEQFAYAASHDMKAPLRKIHFYNTSIAENAGHVLDESSREYLNRSINAVKHLSALIEDLLSYSKSTTQEELFEDVDLNVLVNDIMAFHREEFEENRVKFHMDALPVVAGVSFQLKQLLDNLISNSIKYRHPDREAVISVVADLLNGEDIADAEANPEVQYYKISIIDNGIGFEAKYTEKIFEIFQRLNNHPNEKGSGIGLAICKKIVQNHRGFIRASGAVDEGARFDIYLPILE
jgi:PAS domain S-box-containing protein